MARFLRWYCRSDERHRACLHHIARLERELFPEEFAHEYIRGAPRFLSTAWREAVT